LTWAAALFVVAAFLILAKWFRVPALSAEAIGHCRGALRDLKNPSLAEVDKERAVQSHARRLLVLFFGITLASGAALALPLGAIALLDAAGLLELNAVLTEAASAPFLGAATLLSLGMIVLLHSRRRG